MEYIVLSELKSYVLFYNKAIYNWLYFGCVREEPRIEDAQTLAPNQLTRVPNWDFTYIDLLLLWN